MMTMWAERCQRHICQEKETGKTKRYYDLVKEDIQEVGAREDEVFDRNVWRIGSVNP